MAGDLSLYNIDLHRGIHEFKKGFRPLNILMKYMKGNYLQIPTKLHSQKT
jgi:hypothetical protein